LFSSFYLLKSGFLPGGPFPDKRPDQISDAILDFQIFQDDPGKPRGGWKTMITNRGQVQSAGGEVTTQT